MKHITIVTTMMYSQKSILLLKPGFKHKTKYHDQYHDLIPYPIRADTVSGIMSNR